MFSWWWKGAISTTLQSSIPDSSQLHYCILSWLPNYPKIISVSPSTDITTKLLHCPCWEEWQKHRQRSATIPWNGIQQWKPQFFRCIRRSSSKVLCVKGLLPWPTKPQAPPGNHQTHWQVADPRESPFLLTGVEKMLLYLDVWSPHESSWDNCIVFIGHRPSEHPGVAYWVAARHGQEEVCGPPQWRCLASLIQTHLKGAIRNTMMGSISFGCRFQYMHTLEMITTPKKVVLDTVSAYNIISY